MDRNDRPSRRRVKESLARLLATTAGTLLVASAAGGPPAAQASVAPQAPAVSERARELRETLAAPAEHPAAQAPTQLAWWGNWHNGGWHPYWHNWPNWRNWHNWHNY